MKRNQDHARKQLEAAKIESQKEMGRIHKDHQKSLRTFQEQTEIEKQEWQQNYIQKSEAQTRSRDKLLREQLIAQRDQEIEQVIIRLESESGSNSSESSRRYRMDIERIKSDTAMEIKDVIHFITDYCIVTRST